MIQVDYTVVRQLVREMGGQENVPEAVLRGIGWTADLVARMEVALNNLDKSAGPSISIPSHADLLRTVRAEYKN